MDKIISCGVIILNERQEVFACHATGTGRWDLPKGLAEPGESARDTAVRETWEETSLSVAPGGLTDLGLFDYLPQKRLHLFAMRVAQNAFDIGACRCHSSFADRHTGQPVLEVDGYAWKSAERLGDWCGKNLTRVLAGIDWMRLRQLPEVPVVAGKRGCSGRF